MPKKKNSHVNELEKTLNTIHINLRKTNDGLILKIPVPIELTSSGLVAKQSTVDYSGTLQGGLSIDFDAKETESKTSFPLSNIKEHQVHYLQFKYNLGGVSFFMIQFKKLYPTQVFIVPITVIKKYWDNAIFKNGSKSIKLKEFDLKWLTPVDTYINKVKEIINELRNT